LAFPICFLRVQTLTRIHQADILVTEALRAELAANAFGVKRLELKKTPPTTSGHGPFYS
jgi:hypothetical protein